MEEVDLIVIGTGPAGEKGAVKAAYFGHKVAIIEKEETCGGAGVYTGTLPSKTLRETALYFSGKYEKGLYGIERDLQREATAEDFLFRKNFVSASAGKEVFENLVRHGVKIYRGTAVFEDPHTVQVGEKKLRGKYILIATGSIPYRPPHIPFDGVYVHDSDTILNLKKFPSSISIVGGGVIGCEYATIFSTMGAKVYLIDEKEQLIPHLDREIGAELTSQMQSSGIELFFKSSVVKLSTEHPLQMTLSTGTILKSDLFLFAAGRTGNIEKLGLEKIGVKTGKRGLIEVDNHYCTNVSHIFAAGDVIGFPALASTSMDQGRIAVAYMFQTQDLEHLSTWVPYGIYTVPEISMVGITEEEAREIPIAYGIGKAGYPDMSRGKIMGVTGGFLKLIFERATLQVLGVHIIGPIASELIHYGLMLVKEKKTLYDIIGEAFNYPTLHDLYKYAAYDGLGDLAGHKIK